MIKKEILNLPSTYVKKTPDDSILKKMLTDMLIDETVITLIGLSSDGIEADKEIQRFKPELRGKNTPELSKNKWKYLKKLFPSISEPILLTPDKDPNQRYFGHYYSTIDLIAKGLIRPKSKFQNNTTETQPIQVDYTIE